MRKGIKRRSQYTVFTCDCDNELIKKLKDYNINLDIEYPSVTQELLDNCHNQGILVNCWTVDDADKVQELIDMGVDFITTNILE